jgi:radical SAM protein with 4Fe4S-binding SPASM domain
MITHYRTGSLFNMAGYGIHLALLRISNYPEKASIEPWWIMIEPTSRCNLRCRMCARTLPGQTVGDMPFTHFKRIIDRFGYLSHLRLQGFGEPFLNKDILTMVKYAKRRHIMVETISNGTLLDERLCQDILSSGLNKISVSLDGATKETYESVRLGANFNHVLENVKRIVDLRNETQAHLRITVWTVLMKENVKELTKLVALCATLGVDAISVQTVQYKLDVGISDKEQASFFSSYREVVNHQIDSAFREAQQLKLPITIQTLQRRTKLCDWPWSRIYVTWNGNVLPCCNIFDVIMGNVFSEDFATIWNGDKYRSFRAQLSRGAVLPLQCRGCNFFSETRYYP